MNLEKMERINWFRHFSTAHIERQILLDKTNQNNIPNKICINSSYINLVNFNENKAGWNFDIKRFILLVNARWCSHPIVIKWNSPKISLKFQSKYQWIKTKFVKVSRVETHELFILRWFPLGAPLATRKLEWSKSSD
jgi:hypothetical protein